MMNYLILKLIESFVLQMDGGFNYEGAHALIYSDLKKKLLVV